MTTTLDRYLFRRNSFHRDSINYYREKREKREREEREKRERGERERREKQFSLCFSFIAESRSRKISNSTKRKRKYK
jgi:hypothetical protein